MLKRNGSLQDFNKGKIIDVVVHAGASYQDALGVAKDVEEWLPGISTDNVVEHDLIRSKVVELLSSIDGKLAENFENYQK